MQIQNLDSCPQAARIIRIRARLNMRAETAFWGALALELALVRDDSCETMATDGARLIYCAAFVATLSDAELEGVIIHEVAHCSLGHHARRGGRDPEEWNIAADYAENDWILAAGFTLPADVLIDPKWAGMGAEEIYAARAAERAKRPQPQQGAGQPQAGQPGNGQPQPGQGASGPQNGASGPQAGGQPQPGNGQPGGQAGQPSASGQPGSAGAGQAGSSATGQPVKAPAWGRVLDAAAPHDAAAMAAAESAWQAKVRAAVAVASKAFGAGKLPADIARLVGELDAPIQNWRHVLRRFADNGARRENSWARPSRRYAASGLYLPAQRSVNPCRVVYVVDSSYSMDPAAIGQLMSEGAAMLESGAVDRATVLIVNTRVLHVREFTAADAAEMAEFMPAPGGGTKFSPAFEWIAENARDAAAVVYATDLDCRDYGEEPHCPTLWLQTPSRPQPAPPFGEVIPLDPFAAVA